MSWNPALDPSCPTGDAVDAIETLIIPRARDLGDFEVRRALPAPKRQMVGPFIFFDQAGPAEFLTGQGVDVRPHPHIGLATVTYLFKGEFQHRDSLGSDQIIHAGRGQLDDRRARRHPFGADQRRDPQASAFAVRHPDLGGAARGGRRTSRPSFEHHGQGGAAGDRGRGRDGAADPRHAPGASAAPVKTFSEMFYADVELAPGAQVPLPDGHEDRGLYVVSGSVVIGGAELRGGADDDLPPGRPAARDGAGRTGRG